LSGSKQHISRLKGTSINSKSEDIEDEIPRVSAAVFSGQAIFQGALKMHPIPPDG
jgi:hypothetical protein